MMTHLKSIPVMSVVAIIIGLVLILRPDTTLSLILFTVGTLLIISSIASIVDYYRLQRNSFHPSSVMMLNGIISGLVGLVLVVSPLFLMGFLLTLISIVIILGSMGQLINLLSFRRAGMNVSGVLFVMPFALLVIGIYMLSSPIDSVITITTLLGIGIIIFSALELAKYIITHKETK